MSYVINLSPRRVVRWKQGQRTVNDGVIPQPFGPERAREIYAQRGAFGSFDESGITLEEELFGAQWTAGVVGLAPSVRF